MFIVIYGLRIVVIVKWIRIKPFRKIESESNSVFGSKGLLLPGPDMYILWDRVQPIYNKKGDPDRILIWIPIKESERKVK